MIYSFARLYDCLIKFTENVSRSNKVQNELWQARSTSYREKNWPKFVLQNFRSGVSSS